jgi:hypothetical protein
VSSQKLEQIIYVGEINRIEWTAYPDGKFWTSELCFEIGRRSWGLSEKSMTQAGSEMSYRLSHFAPGTFTNLDIGYFATGKKLGFLTNKQRLFPDNWKLKK